MRNWTHKARQPRKHKRALGKVYRVGVAGLTRDEARRFRQCHFVKGSRPRKVGSHIAMGDSSTINARLRRERLEAGRA